MGAGACGGGSGCMAASICGGGTIAAPRLPAGSAMVPAKTFVLFSFGSGKKRKAGTRTLGAAAHHRAQVVGAALQRAAAHAAGAAADSER